jgi:transposase-like protein
MVLEPIKCPVCEGINVIKHGKTTNRKQRFLCKDIACEGETFIRDYSEKGRLLETKQKILEMALNGSGIRDTARVLGISTATVINELKKRTGSAFGESGVFGNAASRPDSGGCRKSRRNS